jgi:predicted acyl esterase
MQSQCAGRQHGSAAQAVSALQRQAGSRRRGPDSNSQAPYFLDWLDHPTYDSYWKQWSIEENYDKIQVPALTITAWYDIFQGGSLRNLPGLKRTHGGNEAARNGQRLLSPSAVTPAEAEPSATVDFGPDAAEFDENDYVILIGTTTSSWASRINSPTASRSRSL